MSHSALQTCVSKRLRALLTISCIFALGFSSAEAETKALLVSHTGNEADLRAAERALLEGLSAGTTNALTTDSVAPKKLPEPSKAPPAQQVAAAMVMNKTSTPSKAAEPPAPPPQATPKESPEITALKGELATSKRRNADLERQLEQVKGQLTMAETELSRMQTLLDTSSRARLGMGASAPAVSSKPNSAPDAVAARARTATNQVAASEPAPKAAGEMQIATVSAEKADLRLGPGRNNSALMTVSQGSRLAVEARQGEWFRVFAPNGQRAWVHSSVITFGRSAITDPAESVNRVRGFSASLEDEAFQRIQSMTGR